MCKEKISISATASCSNKNTEKFVLFRSPAVLADMSLTLVLNNMGSIPLQRGYVH